MIKIKPKLKGHFTVEVKRGGVVRETVKIGFDNLITNAGRDLIGNPAIYGVSSYMSLGVAVGTGNTEPKPTDTQLVAQVAAKAFSSFDVANVQATAPYSFDLVGVTHFSQGAVVGNIAEVGVAGYVGSTSVPLISRALTQVNGSAAAITVTADDELTVTWTCTISLGSDVTGTLALTTDGAASSVGFTARPINVTDNFISYYFPYGMFNMPGAGNVSGVTSGASALSPISNQSSMGVGTGSPTYNYVAGTYKCTANYAIGSGHAGSYNYAVLANALTGGIQLLFDSPITLTAGQTLTFGVEWDWSA